MFLKRRPIADRFWEKVEKAGPLECWPWTARLNPDGYGALKVGKTNIRAHRLSMMLHGHEVPADKVVCHRCDNPPCVNPAHLYIGTMLENMRECFAKGRIKRRRRGEGVPGAKLTAAAVIQIRDACARGILQAETARKHNVSVHLVYLVNKRKAWKHVP